MYVLPKAQTEENWSQTVPIITKPNRPKTVTACLYPASQRVKLVVTCWFSVDTDIGHRLLTVNLTIFWYHSNILTRGNWYITLWEPIQKLYNNFYHPLQNAFNITTVMIYSKFTYRSMYITNEPVLIYYNALKL